MGRKQEKALYRRLYSDVDLENRFFVNIGAGSFRHPYWINVDHSSDWYSSLQHAGQVEWDIMSMTECPVETDKINAVYCSHTIEHVTDKAVLHMFKEAYRMLKKDGVLRVTAPDAEIIYDAYVRRDALFIENEHGGDKLEGYDASIEEKFLYCFASQRVKFHAEANADRQMESDEISKLLDSSALNDALDQIVAGCSYEIQKRHPGNHINWWSHEKVMQYMKQAGFGNIRRSSYGQSQCPIMRNTAYFDNTRPRISLYVEAIK
jgi:predicted SAM-dependent methyltransferase